MASPRHGRQISYTLETSPPPSRGAGASRIKRFDGATRTATNWDGLRKDSDLWYDNDDCMVLFYTPGASQRGPSLRVPYHAAEAFIDSRVLKQYLHIKDSNPDSDYASSLSRVSESKSYELYIPAPSNSTREQAFWYHVTTRNYFAMATSQPLVGESLSTALTDLWKRLQAWHSKADSQSRFLSFCQGQGYLNFADKASHAIALLRLAEYARMRDLWVDAFVHCVGMHERVDLSPEFEGLSNTTKALIIRASLEMDLHIARVVRAVGGFLEQELGTEHLGLSKPARDHLDRFRSSLHAYYVDKLGYFPPSDSLRWDKRIWNSMYHEFRSLYAYLVDGESSTDRASSRVVHGGVCVVQNVQAFDQRHGYQPLPHPLPLLPDVVSTKGLAEVHKGLRNFRLGRTDSGAKLTEKQLLAKAANFNNPEVLACPLIQAYQHFERQRLEEKLSLTEARKIRWLLVYSTLQMLISITQAPKEVKDTETPAYPLCVLTSGCPPWSNFEDKIEELPQSMTHFSLETTLTPEAVEDDERISIHPDCEAANAEDYFTITSLSRRPSDMSLNMTPHPLRITTQLSRTASIRSSVNALQRSVVGSLSRRNSIRSPAMQKPPKRAPSFCEIVVEGYGNGMDAENEHARHQSLLQLEGGNAGKVEIPTQRFQFDFGLEGLNEEPILDDRQLEHPRKPAWICQELEEQTLSPVDSDTSATTSEQSNSTRSSSYLGEYDSPATDVASWDGRSFNPNSNLSLASMGCENVGSSAPPTLRKRHSYQQKHLMFGVTTSCVSLSAGCYTPTGVMSPPVSRFSQCREESADTVESETSSQYPDKSLQAAEIEEEDIRGLRRSRALDRIRAFGVGPGVLLEEEEC